MSTSGRQRSAVITAEPGGRISARGLIHFERRSSPDGSGQHQHGSRRLDSFLRQTSIWQSSVERDDLLNNMNREIFEAVDLAMTNVWAVIATAGHADCGATLKRVADDATNIAEDVIFWVRGADVRHHGQG